MRFAAVIALIATQTQAAITAITTRKHKIASKTIVITGVYGLRS